MRENNSLKLFLSNTPLAVGIISLLAGLTAKDSRYKIGLITFGSVCVLTSCTCWLGPYCHNYLLARRLRREYLLPEGPLLLLQNPDDQLPSSQPTTQNSSPRTR